MRVLVDMDATIADFFGLLLERYHADGHPQMSVDDITEWDMTKVFPIGSKINDYFYEPGFFAALDPIPGAIQALKKMHDAGLDVTIVTAPCTSHSAAEKLDWCKQYLPFLQMKDVVICGRKELIRGDILIDDSLATAEAYRKAWKHSMVATIGYPYNDSNPSPYDLRVPHEGYARAWRTILDFVMWSAGKGRI